MALSPGAPCPACGVAAGTTAPGQNPPPGASGPQSPPQTGPYAAAPSYAYASGGALSAKQARDYVMWTHLSALVALIGVPSPVGPLVMWLIKRESDPYIDAQGKEALNFNISAFLYAVGLLFVSFVFSFVTFGIGFFLVLPLLLAAGVAWLVAVIVAATKASRGEPFRYPLTIRFVS